MPCVAKHLLSFVLSITPGNFLAEKTSNEFEKHEARTGADPVLSFPTPKDAPGVPPPAPEALGPKDCEDGVVGTELGV